MSDSKNCYGDEVCTIGKNTHFIDIERTFTVNGIVFSRDSATTMESRGENFAERTLSKSDRHVVEKDVVSPSRRAV